MPTPRAADLPLLAWPLLLGLAALKLALHAVSAGFFAYGYMPDELYLLACADHLDWGYVDHPPLSVALLAVWRSIFGDSILSLRLLAGLGGGAALVLSGALARELGGGRWAQALAGMGAFAALVMLLMSGYYSMNALEPAFWAGSAWLVLRIARGGDPRLWLALGALLGLGLLNKHSMLWFGFGLGAALLFTPERRWLVTRWPWLGAALASAIVAPHLIWQVRKGWPTLEFMRNGMRDVMVEVSPLDFLAQQLEAIHPLVLPLLVVGLVYLFMRPAPGYRPLGWIFVTVAMLLAFSGSARPYYLAPAYPLAFAAGGAAVEAWARRRGWGWLPVGVAALLVLALVTGAPIALPLLAPARFVEVARALDIEVPSGEFETTALPAHFAMRFGWEELAETVAAAYRELPEPERSRTGVLAGSFGESAALEHFGRSRGLPVALGTHNSYWLWGTRGYTGESMLVVAASESELRPYFEDVELVAQLECEWCLPYYAGKSVYWCRGSKRTLDEIWPELKAFD